MEPIKASDVVDGTYGKLFLDDEEITSIKDALAILPDAKSSLGFGRIITHKVDQELQKMIIEKQSQGHEFIIVMGNNDPSARTQKKIELTGVKFKNITLYSFIVGELGEDKFPFTFKNFKYI